MSPNSHNSSMTANKRLDSLTSWLILIPKCFIFDLYWPGWGDGIMAGGAMTQWTGMYRAFRLPVRWTDALPSHDRQTSPFSPEYIHRYRSQLMIPDSSLQLADSCLIYYPPINLSVIIKEGTWITEIYIYDFWVGECLVLNIVLNNFSVIWWQ